MSVFNRYAFRPEKVSENVTMHQTFQHMVYGRCSDWLEYLSALESVHSLRHLLFLSHLQSLALLFSHFPISLCLHHPS